ncbi:MAG: branched-chain amino acid aminotransferase [Halioglobus sp.]
MNVTQSIEIHPVPAGEQGSIPSNPDFGSHFSDHMFVQSYSAGEGWSNAEIKKLENFSIHPAAAVLHYGQEIFEGLKAYKRPDGGVNLFRPEENFRRFNESARRIVMPEVDKAFHLKALKSLVALDRRWVPEEQGASLYIRPAMIATSAKLGLGASAEYLHFIMTGPVGPYFKGGFNPVSVYISDSSRRAVIGGIGEAKTGGNYAASLYMSEKVAKLGYTQVLWLDAIHGKYMEEVGAMNICFVYEGSHIVTPKLSGSILAGITRDSVLKLAPALGYEISEEQLDVNDILRDIKSGKVTEAFGCGTAAVISPVGKLSFREQEYLINDNQSGPVARHLYDELTGIQYGVKEDRFGWIEDVDS